ncbi:MAG: transposase [Thermoanaerobaculia bacterium]
MLSHLAAYTHRIAISERRIVGLDGDHVRFLDASSTRTTRRRSREAHGARRGRAPCAVPCCTFCLGRFICIRHFGFLANRVRTRSLALAREQLGEPRPPAA